MIKKWAGEIEIHGITLKVISNELGDKHFLLKKEGKDCKTLCRAVLVDGKYYCFSKEGYPLAVLDKSDEDGVEKFVKDCYLEYTVDRF